MTTERKYTSGLEYFETKEADDGEDNALPDGVLMLVKGYVVTYEEPDNPDSWGDIIDPDAFDEWVETFDSGEPLAMRDAHGRDVGAWLTVENDKEGTRGKKGLWVEGEIYDAYTGRDMATMIKRKVIRGLSAGMTIDEYSLVKTHRDRWGYPVRRVLKSKLKEGSPTSTPANDNASLESFKSELVAREEQKSTGGVTLTKSIEKLDGLLARF